MLSKLLALRFRGVLQSWGYNSGYTYRNTGIFPTKSAVLGLCCAAKGLNRGSQEEKSFLDSVSGCSMTSIAIPHNMKIAEKTWPISIRRIDDFHTVEKTKTASGKDNPNAVVTYRQYLCDSDFIVILEVNENIADDLRKKLADPDWGIWLGRKSCIPSAPVYIGLFSDIDEFRGKILEGKSLSCFTYQKEVASFEEGADTLMDKPLDFAVEKRERGQRRVKIFEAVNDSRE